MPRVSIFCDDAFHHLAVKRYQSIVTSLPDAEELKMPIAEWEAWFSRAAQLCRASASQVVFYQTDRKSGGYWIDKRSILERALGHPRFAKIVLRRSVGCVDLRRPGYSHLIAFGGRGPGKTSADVIEVSDVNYRDGVPAIAAQIAAAWITSGPVCDPFCGRGGFFPPLLARGFECIGVDISEDQCRLARRALDEN